MGKYKERVGDSWRHESRHKQIEEDAGTVLQANAIEKAEEQDEDSLELEFKYSKNRWIWFRTLVCKPINETSVW